MGALLFGAVPALAQAWSGVDPDRIPMAVDPIYGSGSLPGWQSSLEGETGRLRVVVLADSKLAKQQYDRLVSSGGSMRPIQIGDEASSNGWNRTLVLSSNVVIEVHRDSGEADDLALRIFEALEPATDWPTPPNLQVLEGRAWVDGTWARVNIDLPPKFPSTDGDLLHRDAIPITARTFAIPTDAKMVRALAWDRYGRGVAAVWFRPETAGASDADQSSER